MEDRNPSPPPELETDPDVYRADSVGNTVISKKWVLATLMEIIKEVDKHTDLLEDAVVDVSDDLQDSACKLWDLCIDQDVAVFLLDFEIVDILYAVIVKSKSPRITEISVGILGNMACSEVACKAITEKDMLRSVLLDLLASRDTQTLLELTRLLRVCSASVSNRDKWLKSLQESRDEVIQNVQFIFNSSTNGKLLRSLSEVIDDLLEVSTDYHRALCTREFVGALLESIEQISKNDPLNSMHMLCPPLHILHSLTEQDTGKNVIATMQRRTVSVLSTLCEQWMTTHPKVEHNTTNRMSSSEVSVSCSLAIASVLLSTDSIDTNGTERSTEEKGTEILQQIDDEEKEIILKFARCIVSAKGVLSALAVVSSLSNEDQEENQNEFKTPIHHLKGSPLANATTKDGRAAGSTPVLDTVTVATPDRTPEVAKDDATPPLHGDPRRISPVKRSRLPEENSRTTPAVTLCSLAKELLKAAEPARGDDTKAANNSPSTPCG